MMSENGSELMSAEVDRLEAAPVDQYGLPE